MEDKENLEKRLGSMTNYLHEKTESFTDMHWMEFNRRKKTYVSSNQEIRQISGALSEMKKAEEEASEQIEKNLKKIGICLMIAIVGNSIFNFWHEQTTMSVIIIAMMYVMYVGLLRKIAHESYCLKELSMKAEEKQYSLMNQANGIGHVRYQREYEDMLLKQWTEDAYEEDYSELLDKAYGCSIDIAVVNSMNSREYYEKENQ